MKNDFLQVAQINKFAKNKTVYKSITKLLLIELDFCFWKLNFFQNKTYSFNI